MPRTKKSASGGLTLIELLVVVAIIAILALIFWIVAVPLLNRSRDGARKTHLQKYKVVLEEYREDQGAYPAAGSLDNCGGPELQPYLESIYCDPSSHEPYRYVPSADLSRYSLYANLLYEDDPIIPAIHCQNGCGPDDNGDGAGDYNYGINPSLVAEEEAPVVLDPTCGTSGSYFCYANTCSLCCPGSGYRCNTSGTGCTQDPTCQ